MQLTPADVRARRAVVAPDDLPERPNTAVVHVRRIPCHVAKRGRLERSAEAGSSWRQEAHRAVGRLRVAESSEAVELVGGQLRDGCGTAGVAAYPRVVE